MISTNVSERSWLPVPTLGRVESERGTRHRDHPVQVFQVGLCRSVGHGRDAVEPRARGVDLPWTIQKDRDSRLAISGQEQHGRSGNLFRRKPEPLDQRASPKRSHASPLCPQVLSPPAPALRVRVPASRRAPRCGDRGWRVQLRKKPMEDLDRRVASIRLQRLAAYSFD